MFVNVYRLKSVILYLWYWCGLSCDRSLLLLKATVPTWMYRIQQYGSQPGFSNSFYLQGEAKTVSCHPQARSISND